tara:strand:+ start:70 stop:549 length:480 start_codon:yes stop_codon:yes gene_type:complete
MKLSFERKNLNKIIELIEDSNNIARVEFEFKEDYATDDGYVYCVCLGIINNSSFVNMLKKFIAKQKDYDSYIEWLEEDYYESGMGYWEYYNIESLDETDSFYYDKWLKNQQWENEDGDKINIDDYEEEEMMEESFSIRVFINDNKVACSVDDSSFSWDE